MKSKSVNLKFERSTQREHCISQTYAVHHRLQAVEDGVPLPCTTLTANVSVGHFYHLKSKKPPAGASDGDD